MKTVILAGCRGTRMGGAAHGDLLEDLWTRGVAPWKVW